jgi:hypothetical protein
VLDADLTMTPAGAGQTLMTLNGAYRPPLGGIGAELDRVVLRGGGHDRVAADPHRDPWLPSGTGSAALGHQGVPDDEHDAPHATVTDVDGRQVRRNPSWAAWSTNTRTPPGERKACRSPGDFYS